MIDTGVNFDLRPMLRIGGRSGSVKMVRGLPQLMLADSWKRRASFLGLDVGTAVRAGEATVVPLSVSIPSHAEIQEIRGELQFTPRATPAAVRQEAVVTDDSQDPETKRMSAELTLPSGPTTLSLALEGGDPIWSWAGPPGDGETTFAIPEFADAANAYLETVAVESGQSGAAATLRFVLRSDVGGTAWIRVQDDGLSYRLVQSQAWPNELDGTLRMDRNFTVAPGTQVVLPLDPVVEEEGAEVRFEEIRFDVAGELSAERLLGEATPPETGEFATVGHDFAVAQEFWLPEGLPAARLAGVLLGLKASEEAEIYVEVRRDVDGGPAEEAPLGSGTAIVGPGDAAAGTAWVAIRFTEPVDLVGNGTSWWLIAKPIRGSARLGIDREPRPSLGSLLMNRGGRFWHAFAGRGAERASHPAFLRLLHLPTVDTRSAGALVVAELLGAANGRSERVEVRVNPSVEPEAVILAFSQPFGGRRVRLTLRSHAVGNIQLANVVQVYRPTSEAVA